MARKTRKRPASAAAPRSYQPRDFLLAGLGAVALGRREVAAAVADVPARIAGLRDAAGTTVRRAGHAVSAQAVVLRAKAAPVQAAIGAIARDARREIETRLAPALATLGVSLPKARRAKPSPRRSKPAARRRKAA